MCACVCLCTMCLGMWVDVSVCAWVAMRVGEEEMLLLHTPVSLVLAL